jgi:hypothetical protein
MTKSTERRIRKLETKSGKHSTVHIVNWDGRTKAEAIADWETEHGPIGEREVRYLEVKFV